MIDDVPKFRSNHESKLTQDQVRMIRKRLAEGTMIKVLAIDYSVCHATISSIKYNKTYKGVY